jgi:RNA polymerase sigma-70 factor (ECF subfamily)
VCPAWAATTVSTRSALKETDAARVVKDLWPQHYERLRRCAYRVLQDERDADEAVNDAYMAAFGLLHKGKPEPECWQAWLTTVVVRRSLTMRKKLADGKPDRRVTADAFDADTLPAEHDDHPFDVVYTRQLLDRLNERLRELLSETDRAVVGYYADGYSTVEISQLLDMPVSTVSSKRRRAEPIVRQALHDAVTEQLGVNPPQRQIVAQRNSKGELDHAQPGA